MWRVTKRALSIFVLTLLRVLCVQADLPRGEKGGAEANAWRQEDEDDFFGRRARHHPQCPDRPQGAAEVLPHGR